MIEVEINVGSDEIFFSKAYSEWLANAGEEYTEYRRQWETNPKENVVSRFPLHISFESTNSCNLSCVFCSRTIKKTKGDVGPLKVMSIDLYKKIVGEGVQKGLKAIKLNTGDTEPLLVKDLEERIAYAKKSGILEVMFNTNATLLNEERSRLILNSGLDKILISFDSPDKELYEKVRVGARYEDVLENIYRFCELKKEMEFVKPFVGVQMVKMKANAHLVDKFAEMFKDRVDIVKVGSYYDKQETDGEDYWSDKKNADSTFACSQLWQRVHVKVDGTVVPCCGDVENKLVLGNAVDSDIESLWNGKLMGSYRALHLQGEWRDIDVCRKCGLPYI